MPALAGSMDCAEWSAGLAVALPTANRLRGAQTGTASIQHPPDTIRCCEGWLRAILTVPECRSRRASARNAVRQSDRCEESHTPTVSAGPPGWVGLFAAVNVGLQATRAKRVVRDSRSGEFLPLLRQVLWAARAHSVEHHSGSTK